MYSNCQVQRGCGTLAGNSQMLPNCYIAHNKRAILANEINSLFEATSSPFSMIYSCFMSKDNGHCNEK